MKKPIALLLVFILGITMLAGCGGSNDGNAGNTTPPLGGSGNGNTDSGSGEIVEVGELTMLDLGYLTVGYPASAELEDDWIWGKMIKDKNGRYSFDFAAEQNRNNIDVTRDEWVVANQNSTSNFTTFEQEIGGMTDVFCVKYNDVATGPTAHYSVAFAETVDGVAGVKIRINSKADDMKIDNVLALAEVQAVLGSIRFEGNSKKPSADDLNALDWWSGDWYGYWTTLTATGQYAHLNEGYKADCYAVIEINPDGSGTVFLWDDANELGTVSVRIDQDGAGGFMGNATSGSGTFLRNPVEQADWVIAPGFEVYGDFISIEGTSTASSGDYIKYKICLRPWGMLWDDIPEDDRPLKYGNWYVGQGHYKEDMIDTLAGATNGDSPVLIHSGIKDRGSAGGGTADGGGPESGGGADGMLNITYEALGKKIDEIGDYIARQEGDKLTYEFVVAHLGGVEGKVYEDKEDYVRYIWFASDGGGSLITFTKNDGKLMYSNASTSTGWAP